MMTKFNTNDLLIDMQPVYITIRIGVLVNAIVLYIIFRIRKKSIWRVQTADILFYVTIFLFLTWGSAVFAFSSYYNQHLKVYLPAIEKKITDSKSPEDFNKNVMPLLKNVKNMFPERLNGVMFVADQISSGESGNDFDTKKLLLKLELNRY